MIGLGLSEPKIRFGVRQVDGGKRGVLRVVHMAEPNVTLMRDSLEQKPPEGSHTWPIFVPRVLCNQCN